MSDLIRKEAVVNEIVNTPTNSDGYNPVYLSGSATRQLEILGIIERLPKVSEQEIRNKAIEEFAKKLKEKCNSMIAEKWNNEVAPISWANAYADFKDDVDDIAEQMKEVEDV